MSSNIVPFEYGAHQVRTLTIEGEPWFVLADLCRVLELTNVTRVAERLDPVTLSRAQVQNERGQLREAAVVNESGMYEVIIRSDKPEAVTFRRWITGTVLPEIRKTGSFGGQLALTEEQIVARALQITTRKVEALEAKVAEDAPKVLFADSVAASRSTILVGELAKILRANGVQVGQNRLFELLRQDGFLIKREGSDWNMPTQRSMELGLFEIKETAVTHSDGHVSVSKTPKVTGRGQQYFVNRYARSVVTT